MKRSCILLGVLLVGSLAAIVAVSISKQTTVIRSADSPAATIVPRAGEVASPVPSPAGGGLSAVVTAADQPAPAAQQNPISADRHLPDAIAQFDSWCAAFMAKGGTATLAAGEELVLQRRAALKALMVSDPKRAFELAVPLSVRRQLPDSITRHLENRVSGRAFFGVLVADNFVAGAREIRREVVLGDRTYAAFVYGRRTSQTTGEQVPLHGLAIDEVLAVHEDPVRVLEPEETAQATVADPVCPVCQAAWGVADAGVMADVGGRVQHFCSLAHADKLNERLAGDIGGSTGWAEGEPPTAQDSWSQGPKSLLYMRVAFPDDPEEPITEDGAYNDMDQVNQWYVENSYGTTAIIPTVTPLFLLPQTKAWYSAQGTGRLLSDARQVAREGGYDTDNYNLDIVRHKSVPGFSWGGLGYVHGKGVWLQNSGAGVTAHELGHNYGLWHGNFWNATGDSVIGPGSNVEYGNSYDTMGAASAGNNQFNAEFKNELDWLPWTFVHLATNSATYRIFAFDAPGIVSGQKYAIRVKKDYDRNYWLEFRRRFTSNRWMQNGVILNWDAWDNGVADSAGGTHLLDTTPGTPTSSSSKEDSPVVIGRTFSDIAAGVHLTPVAKGVVGGEPWIDVVVNLGEFSSNTAPVANLIVDRTSVAVNESINCSAAAADADGDTLAYAWDFGDLTFGPNLPNVSKSWSTAGEYAVRCTVSDMKGGLTTKLVVITVGSVTRYRISGRVLTDSGLPLEGARVHNGLSGSSYRGTYTDSDGYYSLVNLAAGSHSVSVVKYGFSLSPAGWANPVSVGPSASGLNWIAAPAPVVSITASDPEAAEAGLLPGTFTVARSGSTDEPLAVKLNRSGRATYSSDYSLSPAPSGAPLQIILAPGYSSTNLTVTPVNDTSSEGPETVTLTLMVDPAYVLGSLAEATVTIADNEAPALPSVDVSASSPSSQADNLAPESGSDGAVFTFTRTGSTAGELAVFYSVGGTASNGVDYTELVGVVTIPPGETVARVPLFAIDDAEVEGNETVTLTVLANSAYTGAGDNTTLTIVDNDPTTVSISANDNTAREASPLTATFVVTRVGSLTANLSVNYVLSGSASNGVDYLALPGTVVIPAGKATAIITVTAINDALAEGDETAVASLESSPSYNVGTPGSSTITVVDDDVATVTLTASDSSASETGPGTGAFTFSRTGSTTEPLTVYFDVFGTAVEGADYAAIGRSITIPGGASSAVLTVTPVDDAVAESSETAVVVLLTNAAYATGTTVPRTVTISDNDSGQLPGVRFTFANSQGPESDTTVELSVSLSASSTASVSVNYAVTGGTATSGGTDYTLASGTLTFAAGDLNKSVVLTVNNDTAIENDETIVVTLSNPSGAVLDAIPTHTYTILDDDRHGNVTVVTMDATASESGPDTGTFRFVRSVAATTNLTVYFQVVGSASSPSDYLPLPNSATIPAGSLYVDLLLTPVDDLTDETNETVIIDLINVPGAKIGTSKTATITILDDDSYTNLPIVRVLATDALAAEPGADTGTFEISRDGSTNDALTVEFTVGGTATSVSDYLPALPTSVVIPAGLTNVTLTVTPRNDVSFESNETVVVTLTMLPTCRVDPLAASATVTIVDDEIGVSVATSQNTIEDGSSIGGFTFIRTGNTNSDLTVNFNIAGTATKIADYNDPGVSIVIPAGSEAATLPVVPVNDALPEGIETVVLTLASGTGYSLLSPSNATLLLLDDEATVSIVATDDIAYESDTNYGEFSVTRTGGTNASLTVFFTVGGTASNGVDYLSLSNSVVIPAGANAVSLGVQPIDDADTEGNETVQLTLLPDPAYAITAPETALVTIVDDEVNLLPSVIITSPAAEAVYLASTNVTLLLEAVATDDGRPNPPGLLTLVWSLVNGPGNVTFGSSNLTNTTARFSTNGTYVLRVTASDSQLEVSDEVTVIVAYDQLLAAGLQGYWTFDETSGTTAFDSSGNGRNAAVSGATVVPGRLGNARDFDGVDDFASFASPALTQLTLSAWVYSDTKGDSDTPRIIAMPGYNVRVRRATSSTANALALESQRSSASGEWRTPGDVIFDGAWYHVVASYDSSSLTNVPVFYINGVNQPPSEREAPAGTPTANTGTGYIGNASALNRSWDGRIDDVRLFNRLLTAAEIQLLALGGPTNVAPVVDAGSDQVVSRQDQLPLNASVTDDNRPAPPGAVSLQWLKVSGPGTVEFADEQAAETAARFSAAGSYVLRLVVDDSQVKVVDELTVQVIDPPTISIHASTNVVSEFVSYPLAQIIITRTGSTNQALSVYLETSGTASNGVDHGAIPDSVLLPAGAVSNVVAFYPLTDDLAEGDEFTTVTLLSDLYYTVGTPESATVTIKDRPWDDWRFARFTTSELTNLAISGETADVEPDGLNNLLEYAWNYEPKVADAGRAFAGAIEPNPATSSNHLVLTFTRRKAPTDLVYTVEVSPDFQSWFSGAAFTQELLPAADDGNGATETARVRVLQPVNGGGFQFARLKVQRLLRGQGSGIGNRVGP